MKRKVKVGKEEPVFRDYAEFPGLSLENSDEVEGQKQHMCRYSVKTQRKGS
jgi:hypothetical protein